MTASHCQLYLVSPPHLPDVAAFLQALEQAFSGGPVAALMLRTGDMQDVAAIALGEAVQPLCRARDCALILEGRPELAKAMGADGVHLDDVAEVRQARQLLGAEAQIGVSCQHSRHLAMEAGEAGADYVMFGPFGADADPDLLRWWSTMMEVPCVASGGITPDTAALLIATGVDFLAVSAAVWQEGDGPAAAVRGFAKLLAG
jgi:thiamine-phosphate pyrophosphorylase